MTTTGDRPRGLRIHVVLTLTAVEYGVPPRLVLARHDVSLLGSGAPASAAVLGVPMWRVLQRREEREKART